MIKVSKLNNQQFTLNSDLIETIEQTPDTVISMTTGNKYVVKEKQDEIIERIVNYKKAIFIGDRKGE